MEAARFGWLIESRDVTVLYWPDEADEAERLEREGAPHLLLVDPAATPPTSGSCLQEWLTLPVSEVELQTRLVNLSKRAASHPRRPTVDEFGQLTHRGKSLFLSRIDQLLAQTLIAGFGNIVTDDVLVETVWPEGATNQALRVHVSRLRQRLQPLGLAIKCARKSGYVMTEASVLVDRPVPS